MSNIEKIADFIFKSEEDMTFPKLLDEMEKLGIHTAGTKDFISDQLSNCIYWRNMSDEATKILHEVNKRYNVTLQPYGFDNKGVAFYRSYYPDFPIFNHFLMDKMSAKTQKEFMKKPYLMPVYWVPISKSHTIKRPKK